MGIFYEENKSYGELLEEKKNFLFIGEAGSGKSEILLNTAAALGAQLCAVDIFDMDQSKPLFRSRDMADTFAKKGITVHWSEQFQDAPVSAGGVRASLIGEGRTLMDIGGGQQAARIAGIYSDLLKKEDSVAVYVMNPYRPWSGSIEEIDGTMSHILRSARLDQIYVLGNPNLGCETKAEEVIEGLAKLDEMMDGFTKIGSACVRRGIYKEVKNGTDKYIFPMDLYFKYEWEQ